jgi:hypothetical protein
MRKTGKCVDCTDGEDREIVSGQKDGHPRCRKHDMAHRRDEEEVAVRGHLAGLGHGRYMKERNENFKRLTRMVILVRETTCLTEGDAAEIKAILQPYLQLETDSLRPRTLGVVNGPQSLH